MSDRHIILLSVITEGDFSANGFQMVNAYYRNMPSNWIFIIIVSVIFLHVDNYQHFIGFVSHTI